MNAIDCKYDGPSSVVVIDGVQHCGSCGGKVTDVQRPKQSGKQKCTMCHSHQVTKLEEGRFHCRGCDKVFEPVEFISTYRDPAVALEKKDEFEQWQKRRRKERGRRARGF